MKIIISYIIIFFILYAAQIFVYEWSYGHITCGEALNRHHWAAAPRNIEEEEMYNDCKFRGIKKWK